MSRIALACLATVLSAGTAFAQPVAALVGGDTLAIVDASARKVSKTMKIAGLPAPLVGIDVRPADGQLYGLSADGSVVTIDAMAGKATVKVKLETMLPAGTGATVDFNPVADRLRIIGEDGTNLRANVDDGKVVTDGKLRFAETDMHKGEKPRIVAGAYTNSMKGAKETALFDVDATIGALIKQAPPNDGVLNAVGKFGPKGMHYAFDIVTKADGTNEGWLMIDDTLHAVDLATGKATAAGKISGLTGPVRDIAALPAM
ncbi:DUF4394 domain-containing protein [uncultured Alsobacter sp.]|uniref:DUF4394 domain-containing protein n=1 Tax=uncultured Alsobacter sp. TaxID=1748258 RepID=UPI0025ED9EAA|nr:DUF4394 domain-containing protein [uncultured Alsobacter sp.]